MHHDFNLKAYLYKDRETFDNTFWELKDVCKVGSGKGGSGEVTCCTWIC